MSLVAGSHLTLEVKGLAELDAALREMSATVAAKWANGALLAGSKVIKVAARGQAPVRSGALQTSIRVTRGKAKDDNRRDYYIIAGNRKKTNGAFYAHMVEFGTAPHEIVAKPGRMLYIPGRGFVARVMHPGAKAKPFLGPASNTSGQDAVNAFADYLRTKLTRAGVLNPYTETE